MAIIDWLSTPEGRLTIEYGPKDVCWEYLADGSIDLTDFGLDCKQNSGSTEGIQMPAPYTGNYADGYFWPNNTTYSVNTKIPGGNGQTFNYLYWPKYLSLPVSEVDQSWRDAVGADSVREYMSEQPYALIKPHAYAPSVKSDELATMYEQIKLAVKDGSWKAIYAESDAEFETLLAEMRVNAEGYGYSTYIDWCKDEAVLRKAAEYE
jgi:multiple sugar transport system substrate-binding protein/putative aldouronate transport system substrate-binding protein